MDQTPNQIILNLIQSLNKKPLNDKKDEIIEYIITIGFAAIHNMDRKEFMNNVSTHCNDKRVKGTSGALYAKILQDQLTTNVTVMESMERINTKGLAENKEKIMDWFDTEKVNLKGLKQMQRELFIEKISQHCADNNINNDLDELYRNIFEPIPSSVPSSIPSSVPSPIHNLFGGFIDEINKEKLTEHKDKIMEWVTTNQHLLHTMNRKEFMEFISVHCNDKKVKGHAGKLWGKWMALPEEDRTKATAMNKTETETETKTETVLQTNDAMHQQKSETEELKVDLYTENDGNIASLSHQKQDLSKVEEHIDNDNEIKEIDEEDEDDESDESCYAEYDKDLYLEEQMPTYINRAIWFRSDDEHLEKLVDQSVKAVLRNADWTVPEFIAKLYDSTLFEQNVNAIFLDHFDFFTEFVKEAFVRELLLDAMQQEHSKKDNEDDEDNKEDRKRRRKNDRGQRTHIVHYEHKKDESMHKYRYHIYTDSNESKIDDESKFETELKRELLVDKEETSHEFEWAVWKKKKSGALAQIAKTTKQPTFGYWEILNSPKSRQSNAGGKKPGVKIAHLNIIFELLRAYYMDKIDNMSLAQRASSRNIQEQQLKDDELSCVYCTQKYKAQKIQSDIFIYDDDNEINDDDDNKYDDSQAAHYQLTWWNCRKRTDCNAIAIKNMKKPNVEKYYMRFKTSHLIVNNSVKGKNKPIEWYWYDNDNAEYKYFSDYTQFNEETQYKNGLLHKQIEATFQSNMDCNFPWELFDNDGKHTFNHAQIPHLKLALGRATSSVDYLIRFTRLSSTARPQKKEEKENKRNSARLSRTGTLIGKKDPAAVHVILGMEQVAIDTAQGSIFPRNIKRLKGGKNSLKDQYIGSEPFINDWLDKYDLSTESQQKYFWAHILCIATKIKQMDIEIEHQLVSIPIKTSLYLDKQKSTLFSNSSEVAQEQQDALLYKGFLVPPVLGEAITDEIERAENTSMNEVRESLERLSKTRILQKIHVKEQGLVNDDDEDFVYAHDKYDDQFLEREANMFRFAEIVRKFIIESKYLKNDTSLWPYYKNYSHKEDHAIYHTLVNRFNLSLMYGKHTIFKLFETANNSELIGCCAHFCCTKNKEEMDDNMSMNMPHEIAIRHRRKYAALLLLERWNTLRNLNLLRQQLIVIFNSVDKKYNSKEKKQTQEDAVNTAETYDWNTEIETINKQLQNTLKKKKSGWQFLSEYGNLKDNHPIEISIKQFPYFESFCRKFLFEKVKEERKEGCDLREKQWFREFKQSWSTTPCWWSPKHDLVLLELALKYDINHIKYVHELKSEKAFDFRMRLKDRTTYLEFRHFCAQSANIMHRLKYITNIMVDDLLCIRPSLVDIRVPNKQKKEYNQDDESFIFSDYDKVTHLQYVKRRLNEIEFYKPASKEYKELQFNKPGDKDAAQHEKYREVMSPVVQDIVLSLRDTWPVVATDQQALETQVELSERKQESESKSEFKVQSESESDSEDDDEKNPDPDTPQPQDEAKRKSKKAKETVDPFIPRDLQTELYQVINAFDMIKYGKHMAEFVINQIKEFGMDELWTILGGVMEAIPFKMALLLLYDHIETLDRGRPEQMQTLCLHMVNGTNWRISSALRMAEYFKKIADHDALKRSEWMKISSHFEDIAHESVNEIESDHLLYLLLTIPLYDTSEPMNIIMLALEQKRISFLNNERILSVINHIWYHGATIDIKDEVNSEELSFSDLLPILFFSPFKFYITPVGYNLTLSILFLLYLIYVLVYSFLVVQGNITYEWDLILWILNVGYISYEMSEFLDKGREYFSVSGLMNVFDIMISIIWIVLFLINIFVIRAFHFDWNQYTNIKDLTEAESNALDINTVILKVYTGLFGLQIFLLSTRFLTLFQNTQYLGGLLKIVQMMAKEIFKFFSVALVTLAAFTFGFFFIYGLENIQDPETETPEQFEETILFAFDLFIGGGTNPESVVGAVFTVFLTVAGMLILTNLLIALMTTEYEKFQETAQEEVHFMRIETAMDLAHRDRLMPPPLNVIVYPLGLAIHIVVVLFAVLAACCKCKCNAYSRCSRGTYVFLDTWYCGCNTEMHRLMNKQRELADNTEGDVIQRQLYNVPWWSLCQRLMWISYCKKQCTKCCMWISVISKRKVKENPLTAYHKGCYNVIKLQVKNELDGKSPSRTVTAIHGITTKEYIARYEQTHGVKLHLADTILLKHLTVNTLFCNYCYQPYLEHQVDYSLLPPFRVLLDIISCFVFLFSAWLPLVILFILMTMIEQLNLCFDTSVKSKQSDHGNQYVEFDREYFPHPDEQVVSL